MMDMIFFWGAREFIALRVRGFWVTGWRVTGWGGTGCRVSGPISPDSYRDKP